MKNTLLATLATMHTYCRPHGSPTERSFIARYIATLPNAIEDIHKNWHVTIGDAPIIYSCHTDTVHRVDGYQQVTIVKGLLQLTRRARKRSSCLGADDTVGVFLCREMVLAGVPGHYIFHYGEECGCIGSRDLASESPELVDGYRAAIAFDRAGTDDIITHQMGSRTASDTFAHALADQLNATDATLKYTPCDRGMYTDTESYAEIIPECTNVSIGYSAAHSARETVDVYHVLRLLRALLVLDTSILPIDRDPSVRISKWESFFGAEVWPDDDDVDVDAGTLTRDDQMYLNLELNDIQRAILEDENERAWWRLWTRKGGTR